MATIEERKKKVAQMKARAQKEEAAIRKAERKEDTRKKIIAGARAIALAETNPAYRTRFIADIQANVTKPRDIETMSVLLADLKAIGQEVENEDSVGETGSQETPERSTYQ